MNVVFRVDASTRMGFGHVTRCATLARALQQRDGSPSFICRQLPGNPIESLRREFTVSALEPPATHDSAGGEDYAAWLGVAESADAVETIAALPGTPPDWLVVDHYALGRHWEEQLRGHARRVLVIDDLPDRPHACDALLDQNFAGADRLAHRLVPDGCQPLLGLRYALLAPEYAAQRREVRQRDGSVRRVLVYFGGADPANMTGTALTALSAPGFEGLAVDLVIGTHHPHRDALERQAAGRGGVSVHGTRPHLADLMAAADLAIGAGGTSTWERLCLGLPALVVSIAENQRPTCEALAADGFIEYAGETTSVDAEAMRGALQRLLDHPERVRDLSSRGAHLVDGCGAPRVAEFMAASPDAALDARHALHAADARPEGFDGFTFAWIDRCRQEDVLALRDAPHVLAQMRSREPIGTNEHRHFIERYARADRYDFVLIDEHTRRYVGVFYVTGLASVPELGKYIGLQEYMGRGTARAATERLLQFCRSRAGLSRMIAVTRADNSRNIALNASLGFAPAGRQDEYLVMTREL